MLKQKLCKLALFIMLGAPLAAITVSLTTTSVEAATEKKGWVQENGKWYYYKNNTKVKGWLNGQYFLDPKTGEMKTGWITVTATSNNVGWLTTEEFTKKFGKSASFKFYLDSNGKKVSGLKKIDNYNYYFNPDKYCSCVMGKSVIEFAEVPVKSGSGTNQVEDVYIFDSNGKGVTGWYDFTDYYYNKLHSVPSVDASNSKAKIVYIDNGKLAWGWKTISGKKYYFGDSAKNYNTANIKYSTIVKNQQLGQPYLVRNDFVFYNYKFYFMTSDGSLSKGGKVINTKNLKLTKNGISKEGVYYINTDGSVFAGWKTINGYKYYFIDKTYKDTLDIANLAYNTNAYRDVLNQYGKKIYGDFVKLSTGKTYAFNKSTGAVYTGWFKLDGKYYFANDNGVMYINKWYKDANGKWYHFDSKGVMQTGKQTINKKIYYFNGSGVMQYGWKKISDKWYYFDKAKDGAALVSTSKKIGNKTYKFNSSGVCTNY